MDMLSEDQVSEFKEAFNMFAQNQSEISRESLTAVMKELGMRPSATDVTEMIEEASAGRSVTFNEYITMMADKMNSVDDKVVLIDAFESFDTGATGKISKEDFKRVLSSGNKFNPREITEFQKEYDAGEGMMDYMALVSAICK